MTEIDDKLLTDVQALADHVLTHTVLGFLFILLNKGADTALLHPRKISREEWEELLAATVADVREALEKDEDDKTVDSGMLGAVRAMEDALGKLLKKFALFTTGHPYCNAVRLMDYYERVTKPERGTSPVEEVEAECQTTA